MKKIIIYLALVSIATQLPAFDIVAEAETQQIGDSYIGLTVITPISRITDMEILKNTHRNYPNFQLISLKSSDMFTTIIIRFRGEIHANTFVYARDKNQFSYYTYLIGSDLRAAKEYSKVVEALAKNNWVN